MPIRMNKIKFFLTEDLAAMLPIDIKTIQRYIREGRIHGIKIGRLWYVANHSLNEFLETGGVKKAKTGWK